MKPIRTAVVGVGHFGSFHAEKYAADPRAELVAVVDADAARAQAVAARLGTRALSDPAALAGAVDAVSIAVPTAAHHPVARFFLDRGVHVLVEKPFTATVAEADDLIARARAGGLVLQVGHLERFFCAESGILAAVTAPVFIEALRIAEFRPRGADVSVVLDLMIHDIDLVAALVGAPVSRVDAVGAPVFSASEDIVNARLVFENGCVATITASRVAFRSERKVRVFQPEGLLTIDLLERRVRSVRKSAADGSGGSGGSGAPGLDVTGFDVTERDLGRRDTLKAQIGGFLEAVATGGRPVVTGEDGRAAVVIAGQVTDSLRAHLAILEARLQDRSGAAAPDRVAAPGQVGAAPPAPGPAPGSESGSAPGAAAGRRP